MRFIVICCRKCKSVLANTKAMSAVGNMFIFLISMIILLLILRSVELIAIVKNSRDSLERATLSVAAVNEYKLYNNFRENVITDEALTDFITASEINKVLKDEFNLIEKPDGMYKTKQTDGFYFRLTNINSDVRIEDNTNVDRYRITTSADLYVPVSFLGFEDMQFNLTVSCVYASKLNAEE